jgi:hypothetical protein
MACNSITATTFAELRTTCKKSCTRTNPANMVQQLTKLHNNAAWHRRARFQLQREPLCAMCLAEGKVVAARIADHIEPHHDDPIRFWNGKLRSLCARIATRAGRSSWRTAALTRQSTLMAGRPIYGIRAIGIFDSGGLGILFGGCAFSIPVVCELLEGDSCPARFATKVIGFARTLGVRSIRASSIRAIAIMTNAVETNRILSSPLKLMYDTSFSSRLVLRASPPDLY